MDIVPLFRRRNLDEGRREGRQMVREALGDLATVQTMTP